MSHPARWTTISPFPLPSLHNPLLFHTFFHHFYYIAIDTHTRRECKTERELYDTNSWPGISNKQGIHERVSIRTTTAHTVYSGGKQKRKALSFSRRWRYCAVLGVLLPLFATKNKRTNTSRCFSIVGHVSTKMLLIYSFRGRRRFFVGTKKSRSPLNATKKMAGKLTWVNTPQKTIKTRLPFAL